MAQRNTDRLQQDSHHGGRGGGRGLTQSRESETGYRRTGIMVGGGGQGAGGLI